MQKKVAITGSTGGILSQVCIELVKQNCDLILINRNVEKTEKQKEELLKINNVNIDIIKADMSSLNDIDNILDELKNKDFEFLILGSAVYNVPLKKLELGYNNVFQINFISPVYLTNKLLETNKDLNIIVIGSIAYNYTKINEEDIDLSSSKKGTHIYGNSKRYLMSYMMKKYPENISISHPGITLTNLTNHYPKWINWLVKIGIKLIFPSNKKAARNILYAMNNKTGYMEWIGPKFINLYGRPKIKKIKKLEDKEVNKIYEISEDILKQITARKGDNYE